MMADELLNQSPLPQADIPHVSPPPVYKFHWILITLIILIFGAFLFVIYQNQQLKKQISSPPVIFTSTPSPSVPAWKKFTSSTYQVSYPSDLIVNEEPGSVLIISKWGPTQKEGTELFDGFSLSFQPREISNTPLLNYVQAKIEEIRQVGESKIITGPDPVNINNYSGYSYISEGLGRYKIIILESSDKKLFMVISVIVADPGKFGFQSMADEILATFRFVNPDIQPTSKPTSVTYSAPASWKRADYYGLKLCLPPNWAIDGDGIYFERDSAYRPLIVFFRKFPYAGGSTRSAYFSYWEKEYPNAAGTSTVSELNVNNYPLLQISGPEGENIVFAVNTDLYAVSISNWNYANDIKSRFLSDFFTMLSCSF